MTTDAGMEEREKLAVFLDEAARYFEARDTGGEDRAHWANVFNAENCRKAASLLRSTPPTTAAPSGREDGSRESSLLSGSVTVNDPAELVRQLREIGVKICDEAADEIERQSASPWRPITTAPKTGRRVLLWLPNVGYAVTAYWDGVGCWYVKHGAMVVDKPTHWRPELNGPNVDGTAPVASREANTELPHDQRPIEPQDTQGERG